MTPSKRRREGRRAYDPGATSDDRDLLNPYLISKKWGARSYSEDWVDGWHEAESAYLSAVNHDSEHWVMATWSDGVEEQIGEVTFDFSNPPMKLEINGVTYERR